MKELLHYLKKLYTFSGKILYFNLVGLVIVSLLDGAAILLLIPMLSIGGILNFSNEYSSIWSFFGILKGFSSQISLPLILIVFVLLTVGQNFLQRNIAIRDVNIQQGFMNKIKEDIYRNLLHVKWEFYIKNRKSDLINSLTKDIVRVGMGIKLFMQLTTNLVFTIVQIGIVFWLSPEISSIVVICGLGLAFFSWRFVKQSKSLGMVGVQLSRDYLAGVTDNLNAIKDIKTNNLEGSRMQWLKSLNSRMLDEQVNFIKIQTTSQLSYKIAMALILANFIMLSVTMFNTQPENLLMVILIFGRLWPRFVTIQSNLQQLALTIPSFKILSDLQTATTVSIELGDENAKVGETIQIEKMIECRNVTFRYNTDFQIYALKDITLQIPANSMTAIVGKSGAGKSSLVDILMGLNRPESGDVIIDGLPLGEGNLVALRKNISFVPQDPFLFNASIRENLLLMEPGATEEQLWEALEFAVADDFVKQLPDGLDTTIGDRGIRLSGGERQRLVLARAILRKPSLLVLDEATSALDTENEAKIQVALERLKGKMTIIIIAHRLSTIQKSDQVIVLEKGEIVHVHNGEYDQLSKEKEIMFNHFLDKKIESSL